MLLIFLFCLQSSFAEKSLEVGSRRMSDTMSGTRMRAPYIRQYQDWTGKSKIRNIRSKSKTRSIRKSPSQGSLTFSSLLHFSPETETFSNTRYPRLSSYLKKQQTILMNITDELALLDLACKIQPCSKRLRRYIVQGMERRHYARNRRNDQSIERFLDVQLWNIADNSKSFNPEVKDVETAKNIEKLYGMKDFESLVTDFHISDREPFLQT
jgi:hypothetical protein